MFEWRKNTFVPMAEQWIRKCNKELKVGRHDHVSRGVERLVGVPSRFNIMRKKKCFWVFSEEGLEK
jgi:hypothetical protein